MSNTAIWHPYTTLKQAESVDFIVKAKGASLYLKDNTVLIDGIGSWWVNVFGHCNAKIMKAIARQTKLLDQVIFANFLHQPALDLSRELLAILPKNQGKVFFSDNGSTAVEVALKIAIQYFYNEKNTNRKIIFALKGAFHGDTFGAMAVGERGLFTEAFSERLFDVCFIDPYATEEDFEKELERINDLAKQGICFIYEPLLQGANGMTVYSSLYLEKLLNVFKHNGVITIADEVFTGFGRTGKNFASEYLQTQPDVMCLSKGLTGGAMALGITTVSNEIFKAFDDKELPKTFYHGHSFTANPLACTAAVESCKLLQETKTQLNIKRIHKQHSLFINSLKPTSKVKDIRCIGTVLALELNAEQGYLSSIRDLVTPFFKENGVFLRPLGNVLYLTPPYCITNKELNVIYKAIRLFVGIG
jgi:adenosylmethionine-8-amino-7-oxononanoate aminotransferase